MKKLLVLSFLASQSLFAAERSFTECRVVKETNLRSFFDETIEADSIAVLKNGRNILLNDILTDKVIHFKSPNGKISESYQWFYARLNPVTNRTNKFLSTSYNEDVVVTIGNSLDQKNETTITYAGVYHGEYLRLLCK